MSGFRGATPRWADPRRPKRSAVAATVVTAMVVVVIVAAVGAYFFLTSTSEARRSPTTYSSTSRSTTLTSSAPSASTEATGASFPFELSFLHSSDAIVSPDGYTYIVVLEIHHPNATANESVTLSSASPAGIEIGFSPPSPVVLPATSGVNVTLDITASPSASLGNSTIQVTGVSGAYSQAAGFTLMVVEYRVVMSPSSFLTHSLFFPGVLNVTVGSTVYWQNLDGPTIAGCGPSGTTGTGYHSLVFTTLPGADSPTIRQFEIYSYTFTSPGSYFYYSSVDTDHLMNGTINVLSPDGGMGMVARLPAFSHFKASPSSNETAGAGQVAPLAGAASPVPPPPHVEVWVAAVDLALLGVGLRVGGATSRSKRCSRLRRPTVPQPRTYGG